MERFQEAREKALKNLKAADHILSVTYPLIQDTKLLLGVIDNLFLTLTNSIGAILWHDRLFKLVPPFQDTFESKFNMFRARCVRRYSIDVKFVNLLQEIKEIVVLHRKSPVEFRRKDRFIICTDSYAMKAITVDQIKNYIKDTKLFVKVMEEIVRRNERIFGGSTRRIKTG